MHAKAEARQSVNKLGDVIAETIHTLPHPPPSFRIFHASKLNRFHASEINNKPHDLFSSLIPGRLALFNTQGMSYPIFRATGDDRFLTDRNYTNKYSGTSHSRLVVNIYMSLAAQWEITVQRKFLYPLPYRNHFQPPH